MGSCFLQQPFWGRACPLSPSDFSNCSLPGLCDTLSYLGHRLYKSWFITFSCDINPMGQGLLVPPFYRQGDQGLERVSNLPKVTQLLVSSDWRAWLGIVLRGSSPFAFSTSSPSFFGLTPHPKLLLPALLVSHSSLLRQTCSPPALWRWLPSLHLGSVQLPWVSISESLSSRGVRITEVKRTLAQGSLPPVSPFPSLILSPSCG